MPITVVLIAETTSILSTTLAKHYTTYTVRSGKKGIEVAKANQAKLIILDAVSLGTSGERICKRLRQEFPDKYIIHIHPKPKKDADSPADIILKDSVSTRSLLNKVKQLIAQEDSTFLRCGTFQLDIERRILMVNEQETLLTPKQSALLEIFFRHPNEILEREWLMQQIWRTSYTEDTRTLNVHIRYVREIIENKPNKPKYIKTVRGKGYRFEVNLAKNKKADN